MRSKLLLIFLIFTTIFVFYGASLQMIPCKKVKIKPDYPDDTCSIGEVVTIEGIKVETWPKIGLWGRSFLLNEMAQLLGGIGDGFILTEPIFDSEVFLEKNRVLLLTTGSLFGTNGEEVYEELLKEYLNNGGTIIVFPQQHGSDYSVLPTPSGHPIVAYGWRES